MPTYIKMTSSSPLFEELEQYIEFDAVGKVTRQVDKFISASPFGNLDRTNTFLNSISDPNIIPHLSFGEIEEGEYIFISAEEFEEVFSLSQNNKISKESIENIRQAAIEMQDIYFKTR